MSYVISFSIFLNQFIAFRPSIHYFSPTDSLPFSNQKVTFNVTKQ